MFNKFFAIYLLLSFVICALGEFNLTVVHIADFHSHWFEYDENKTDCSERESNEGKCFGGYPRLISFVRDIRKKEKNVLVLSSGEFFLGRSLNPIDGWRFAHAMLPKLELDAMSLSNHDFDSGVYHLSALLYTLKFPILCANMWARNTTFLYSRVNKSAVVEVGGEKIGIVGYIHRHAKNKTNNAVSVEFFPEIPALKKEVHRLKRQGINKIIALGHAGYYTDLEIAKKVKGVDIVIGGDSDIMLFDPGDDADESKKVGNIHGNYPRVHHHPDKKAENDTQLLNKTLVLHIPQHGMYVGVLRATFDDQGKIIQESGEPVLLDYRIPQDKDTLEFMKFGKSALENITEHSRLPQRDEVLGKALDHLDGSPRSCRMRECSLGNFLTDAILHEFTFHYRNNSEHRYEAEQWGPIDAVVFNAGTILRSIEPGFITLQHIVKSLSLGGFVNRVYMSGQHLLDMMEHSVRHYDVRGVTPPGAFLQIAGLKVEYDLSKMPGSRVRNLTIRCRDCGDDNLYLPVKQFKTYIIGMPTFLRDGRDGFYDFEEEDTGDYGQFDALLVVEYLRRMFNIEPKLDGRIKFYDPENEVSEKDTISSTGTPKKNLSSFGDLDLSAIEERNMSSSVMVSLNESSTLVLDFNDTAPVEDKKPVSKSVSSTNVSATSFQHFQEAVSENKSSTPSKDNLSTTSVKLENESVSTENETLLQASTVGIMVSERKIEGESRLHSNEQTSKKVASVDNENPLYKERTLEEVISNEIIQKDPVTSKPEKNDFNELEEKKFENLGQNQNVIRNSLPSTKHPTPEAKESNFNFKFQDGNSTNDALNTSDTFEDLLNSTQEKPSEKVQKVIPSLLEDENILDQDSDLSDNKIEKRSLEEKMKNEEKETDLLYSKFFSSLRSVYKTVIDRLSNVLQLVGSTTSDSMNATMNKNLTGVTSDKLEKPTVSVDETDKTSNVTPGTFTEEFFKWIESVSQAPLQKEATFLNEKMKETRSLLKKIYHFFYKNTTSSIPILNNFV